MDKSTNRPMAPWEKEIEFLRAENKRLRTTQCSHATGKHDEECDLVQGLSAENKKLQTLIYEHHSYSIMRDSAPGDFCPVCVDEKLYNPDYGQGEAPESVPLAVMVAGLLRKNKEQQDENERLRAELSVLRLADTLPDPIELVIERDKEIKRSREGLIKIANNLRSEGIANWEYGLARALLENKDD